jgi:hypothetical protein
MAYTAQIGNALNAEGAFNSHFATQVTGKGLPAFMPSAVVNYQYPYQPVTYPSFSVTHLGAVPTTYHRDLGDGTRAAHMVGQAQIDCWESYNRASGQALYNLRVMSDMVARVFATGAAIGMLNVYGSTATPTANGTLVRAEPAEYSHSPPDQNPDVMRVTLLVRYSWEGRVSA